jgi:hypothetical protein
MSDQSPRQEKAVKPAEEDAKPPTPTAAAPPTAAPTTIRSLEESGYEQLPLGHHVVLVFVNTDQMRQLIQERQSEDFDPRPIVRLGFDEHIVKWIEMQDAWFGRNLENALANSTAAVVAAQAVANLEYELRRMVHLAIEVTISILIRQAIEKLPLALPHDDNGDLILAQGTTGNYVLTQSAWRALLVAAAVKSPGETRADIAAAAQKQILAATATMMDPSGRPTGRKSKIGEEDLLLLNRVREIEKQFPTIKRRAACREALVTAWGYSRRGVVYPNGGTSPNQKALSAEAKNLQRRLSRIEEILAEATEAGHLDN